MQLELNDNEVSQILYALNELAYRRQQQAIDVAHLNVIAANADLAEAGSLRALITDIKRQQHNERK